MEKLQNPIKEAKLTGQYTYEDIAEIAELHIQTIYALAKMSNEQLKKVEVGTFIKLKKRLKIDLAKNIKYD